MSIKFCDNTKTFYLNGKGMTYAFFINEFGYAEHLYFGKTVSFDDLRFTRAYGMGSRDATMPGIDNGNACYNKFQAEISFYGTGDYREPSVEVLNPNGDRLTELLYEGHEILETKPKISGMPSMNGGETLVLHLKDKITSFACDLYYTVYDDCSVIARRAVFKNETNGTVILNRAYSFAQALPDNDYEALTLYGGWARERIMEKIPLHRGVVSIDSKKTASSAVLNPFMGLLSKGATEESGDVYGFNLVYSSSYAIKAEVIPCGNVHIVGGINDFDFTWKLEKGESFETPEAVIAYSNEGLGGMSRAFHDAYRNHLINKRFVNKPRPIVINNWEGTYFNFTAEKLMKIADGVKGTGIDTFVLDDGWFGKRDNDRSGLGDWFVNESKLAGGLDPVIKHINVFGMKFGLWFEPEMISEDSDIYRAHPDYAVGAPERPHCYSRHQFMMDITRSDVRDYIVNCMNVLLKKHNIEYVKWDFNRNITESFSVGREADRQQEYAHRYALGLYDLFERIVEANPNVFFEGCSGGGARFDPAILYYFPQIWTSDDSDAEERTRIQYGTSIVYPLSSMSCHVSDVPNHQTGRITSFETRAAIAHLGATGYELDASKFTDEDRERTKAEVDEYKSVSDLVLNGDLYRVDDPFTSNFFTVCVVSKDKSEAEMIAYRRIGSVNNAVHKVKAMGLDGDKTYFVTELGIELRGSTLMNVGWQPNYPKGDFTCVKYHFKEVK